MARAIVAAPNSLIRVLDCITRAHTIGFALAFVTSCSLTNTLAYFSATVAGMSWTFNGGTVAVHSNPMPTPEFVVALSGGGRVREALTNDPRYSFKIFSH
jgi:hypothetical protein